VAHAVRKPEETLKKNKGESMNQYRQGDVLITKIEASELPKRLREVPEENGKVILAHGEATGHAHVVEGKARMLARPGSAGEGSVRFLKVSGRSTVVHDEHDPITLTRGVYKFLRQREYVPSEESPRGRSRMVYD
jgi:hypothetical protein